MMRQVLSKKQLSSIRGGARWQCKVVMAVQYLEDEPILIGPTEIVEAESAQAAADYLHNLYGAGQVNCTAA